MSYDPQAKTFTMPKPSTWRGAFADLARFVSQDGALTVVCDECGATETVTTREQAEAMAAPWRLAHEHD